MRDQYAEQRVTCSANDPDAAAGTATTAETPLLVFPEPHSIVERIGLTNGWGFEGEWRLTPPGCAGDVRCQLRGSRRSNMRSRVTAYPIGLGAHPRAGAESSRHSITPRRGALPTVGRDAGGRSPRPPRSCSDGRLSRCSQSGQAVDTGPHGRAGYIAGQCRRLGAVPACAR